MATFKEIINSAKPVLVDFSAEWCGPCKMLKPVLEQLKSKMGDQLTILKVDVEPLTINGGIPYLSSGILCNSKALVVGSLTTGPELIMLSRGFKM